MSDSKPRILIVDDQEGIRLLVKEILGVKSYDIVEASNGKEALDIFRDFKADVVITDIMMPVMDGFELIEGIKSISPDTIIIAMTGFGTIEDGIKAMKMGAAEYLLKPFDSVLLVKSVEKAIHEKALSSKVLRLEKILALEQASRLVATDADLNKLFNVLLELSVKSVNADSGAIIMIDPELHTPSVVCSKEAEESQDSV